LSVWLQERERERENDQVGMRSLIIFRSHRKVLSSTFSRQLNKKSFDNQSNKVIFANAALLLFLSSQSNCNAIFAHVTISRLKIKYKFFIFPCFQVEIHLYPL